MNVGVLVGASDGDDVGQLLVVGNADVPIVLVIVLSQLIHVIGQPEKAENPYNSNNHTDNDSINNMTITLRQ